MILRVLLASVLAAAVLFGWGFLFWVISPFGAAAMEEEPFGGESMVIGMSKVLADTGVYSIPYQPNPKLATEDQIERFERRHREGPLVRIFYNKTGAEPFTPAVLIQGYMHNFAISLLIAGILALAVPALPTFMKRLAVVFLVGAVAALWLGLNEAIWFHHPWKFELYQAGYVLVGGLLMGFIMAGIIKPRSDTPPNVGDRGTIPL